MGEFHSAMQMTGEQRVAAPRDKVWEALNDPEVLRAAIPGCQSLEKDGDDRFLATIEVKIGPIGARFKGAVQLSDQRPGEGYTLTGEGSAGIAGSAKGSARVSLGDAGEGATLVSYDVDSQVSGRLAQLGGPLIDATAKQLAGKFFAKFGEVVGTAPAATSAPGTMTGAAPAAAPALVASPTYLAPPAPAPASRGLLWGWIVVLVVALIAGFTLGQAGAPGSMLLTLAILLVLTAAAAFEAGRRGSRP
jgi:carbon monoxide dehydrogenase subunit G